jgi:UDP-glucuronate 4-epimerase
MTNILVTGSAGFIGFHTAKKLLDAGETVIGLDNFTPYYAPRLKQARSEILQQEGNFVFVEADLADRTAVARVFSEYSPDLVCHLAAQVGVRYSLIDPYSYERSNLAGFLNIIEAARSLPVRRFVYASSSSVYGANTKMPYSEDDPVTTPISLYAATKRSNELMAHTYTHLWGLQTVGLRFFSVYGEWGRPDMAYWSFLENILNGVPIKIFNYGNNLRDFTYIDDIVAGVVGALYADSLDPCEIINLGNNEPVKLMDFVETLETLVGETAQKELIAAQPGDVVATYADIDRAAEKLAFRPCISIGEGLERFVAWYMDMGDLTAAVREFRLKQAR